jgi:DNA-binding HxlR family transcriptional regulator
LAKQNVDSESRPKVAEVLGLANAVDLILLMNERGEIKTSDVREVPGGYYRLKDVLDKLVLGGIVERKLVEKPYVTYFYKLTETGIKVAEKLVEIDGILS